MILKAYSGPTAIYTDNSKLENGVGSVVYSQKLALKLFFRSS